MATETERKFLVNGNFKDSARKSFRITQAYLSSHPERNVRVRIKEDKGFITVKGTANKSGMSRFEWEKEITIDEAKELLNLCEPGIIDKTRYIVPFGKHLFEVDEFHGQNKGLIIAEIELSSEEEKFSKPNWLGREVTGIPAYYNAMLMRHPYLKWNE